MNPKMLIGLTSQKQAHVSFLPRLTSCGRVHSFLEHVKIVRDTHNCFGFRVVSAAKVKPDYFAEHVYYRSTGCCVKIDL